MDVVFVCGFAWEPKGSVRARAFPLAVELARMGNRVTILISPYDNVRYSAKRWNANGVNIENIEVSNSKLSALASVRQLLLRVRQLAPHVVHVFKPKGVSGAVADYLLMRGARNLVIDADDWEGWGGWNEVKSYNWFVKQWIDSQERRLLSRAPAVTVASRILADRATQIRGCDSDVYYVPNCISRSQEALAVPEGFAAAEIRSRFRLPESPLIFYAGHFEAADDVSFFARSASRVASRHGAHAVLVGDGPELELAKQIFLEAGAGVSSFGEVSYHDYCSLLYLSDVAAFPYPDSSVYRAKCSARIIDYMMFGKAIITSRVGQNTEYMVHGESGLLVPAGDQRLFEESLESLLRSPSLRASLGVNASNRIRRLFRWEGAALASTLRAYSRVSRSHDQISTERPDIEDRRDFENFASKEQQAN